MARTPDDGAPCTCGFVAIGGSGQVYNEEAFRYFLNIESKRAERSQHALVLVLLDKKPAGHIDSALACKLFAALGRRLRETDFIGWYQEARVAGAVLLQRAEASQSDISKRVHDRVTRIIAEQLERPAADQLQIRVFQLPSSRKDAR